MRYGSRTARGSRPPMAGRNVAEMTRFVGAFNRGGCLRVYRSAAQVGLWGAIAILASEALCSSFQTSNCENISRDLIFFSKRKPLNEFS